MAAEQTLQDVVVRMKADGHDSATVGEASNAFAAMVQAAKAASAAMCGGEEAQAILDSAVAQLT